MSKAVTALQGARFTGVVEVAEREAVGMLTLRGDLALPALQEAATGATGVAFPKTRGASISGDTGLCWMSPDELLVLVPRASTADAVRQMSDALAGTHHMVVDVSDARAVITLTGPGGAIRDVLAKLTPADLRPSALGAGEMRRTRMGQVPAALWFEAEDSAHVICFRSVAEYVFGLLRHAAEPGSEVGYFG